MEISGIVSGDLECWCLLVTKEDFKRVTDREPDEEFDVGHFASDNNPFRYAVYPDDLIKAEHKKLIKLKIEIS